MESDFKPTICIDIDGVILTLQEQTQMLALIEKATPKKLEAVEERIEKLELRVELLRKATVHFAEANDAIMRMIEGREWRLRNDEGEAEEGEPDE